MASNKRRYPHIVAVRHPKTKDHRGWRAQLWVARKLVRGLTRDTQAEAFADAQDLLQAREAGSVGDDAGIETLGGAMKRTAELLDIKNRRDGTKLWFDHQFDVIEREWPRSTKLKDIGRREVQAWITKRMKDVSINTVHHHLRALRRLFRVAGKPSPTADPGLVVPDQVPARLEVLDWTKDVVELLAEVKLKSERDWGVLGLTAYSGLRRAEIARLPSWQGGTVLHVEQAKVAKAPRALPCPPGLVAMIEAAALPVPGETEEQRLEWMKRLSKRWDVRLHALRHAFGSELARRGIAVHVIALLLGHVLPGMTMRYVHSSLPELRAAMEKLW